MRRTTATITPNKIEPIKVRKMQVNLARRLFRYSLLAALFGVVSTGPVVAESLKLPALVQPASQEHHVGKVILVELVTPNLAAAKQFYSGLFGGPFAIFRSARQSMPRHL